jgi:Tfp pilus assembly protein PilV
MERRRLRGIALIEVIVAAVILGLAITLMLGLVARAISSQSEGERLGTAARLADEQLNLVLALGCEGYTAVRPPAGPCDEPFSDYRYEVAIAAAPAGQPYAVRATISWQHTARERSLSLDTLIAPRLGDNPDPDRKPQETIERDAS